MTDWDQAACNGLDTGIFFDHEDTRGEKRATSLAAARSICATCTIRTACLNYAVDTVQAFGVWGGLTAAERTEIIVATQRRELLTPVRHHRAAS
jgi:WhiB family transcriptional regulator, redox-sensing transcriptional regulator